jgi:hypothetical protein
MIKRHNSAIILAICAVVTVALLTLPALFAPAALPANAALAPTPVANLVENGPATYFSFQPATAIAADTNTSARDIRGFNSLDVQYVIDHGTVNTSTLTVQYSIDNSNWTDGAVLVSASAADGNGLVARIPAFGRYMRINQNLTNTNTITITLVAVGR